MIDPVNQEGKNAQTKRGTHTHRERKRERERERERERAAGLSVSPLQDECTLQIFNLAKLAIASPLIGGAENKTSTRENLLRSRATRAPLPLAVPCPRERGRGRKEKSEKRGSGERGERENKRRGLHEG